MYLLTDRDVGVFIVFLISIRLHPRFIVFTIKGVNVFKRFTFIDVMAKDIAM